MHRSDFQIGISPQDLIPLPDKPDPFTYIRQRNESTVKQIADRNIKRISSCFCQFKQRFSIVPGLFPVPGKILLPGQCLISDALAKAVFHCRNFTDQFFFRYGCPFIIA